MIKKIISLFVMVFAVHSHATADFQKNQLEINRVKSDANCSEFTESFTDKPHYTKFDGDQIMVLKNGMVAYEWTRPDVYELDQLHLLMSSSKSITALVVAAGIEKGLSYKALDGTLKVFNLETSVSDFFSYEQLARAAQIQVPFDQRSAFADIKIKHLLMMSSGIFWNESYSSFLESSFFPVLYTDYRDDIIAGALNTHMEYLPGQYFNYSGGNAIMLLDIMGRVYCDSFFCAGNSKSKIAAKALLFDPLQMDGAFFESDPNGNLVASSYAYMKPKDMLKIGHLLNSKGVWQGRRLLPKHMTDQIYMENPVFTGAEVKIDSREHTLVLDQGYWHPFGWGWKNSDVNNCFNGANGFECKKIYDQDWPNSPSDMLVFAGHFGNNIVSSASEDLVLVTTGQNDDGYWQKLDYIFSKAVQCFGGKKSAAPLPKEKTGGLSLGQKLRFGVDSIKTEIAQSAKVKDMCSCLYVTELRKDLSNTERVELCKQNTPSDGPRGIRNHFFHVHNDEASNTVTTYVAHGLFGKAKAKYFGNENGGCRLVD